MTGNSESWKRFDANLHELNTNFNRKRTHQIDQREIRQMRKNGI